MSLRDHLLKIQQKARREAAAKLASSSSQQQSLVTLLEPLAPSPACEVFTIQLVAAVSPELSCRSFAPAFLHQVYDGLPVGGDAEKGAEKKKEEEEDERHPEEELIVGWASPRVVLSYTAGSLRATVSFQHCEEETAKHRRPSVTPVLQKLERWFGEGCQPLNGGVADPRFAALLSAEAPAWLPPGVLVHRYQANGRGYGVFRATLAEASARAFHERAEFFAVLFIDGARYIDLADESWIVYYLFEHAPQHAEEWHFAGYLTVHPFFSFPDTVRLRVAQIFVLPPFQRSGHGEQLLRTVYRDARQPHLTSFIPPPFNSSILQPQQSSSSSSSSSSLESSIQSSSSLESSTSPFESESSSNEHQSDKWPCAERAWDGHIYDVTMEDPAPGFQRLRDTVDLADLLEAKVFPEDASFPLSEELFGQVRARLKLTKPQIFRMYHLVQLSRLVETDKQALDLWTSRVKKYLSCRFIERLAETRDPQAALDELFMDYSNALIPVITKRAQSRSGPQPSQQTSVAAAVTSKRARHD